MMITEVCDHAAFTIRLMLSRNRMRRVDGSTARDVGVRASQKIRQWRKMLGHRQRKHRQGLLDPRPRQLRRSMSGSMRKKARNASSTGNSGVDRL